MAGAKVIGVLDSHFHEDLDPDAKHAGGEDVPPNDFGKVFTGHGSGVFRIGHGYEESHAHFIARFAGLEKDTGAGNTYGTAQVFKVILLWVGRTDAHELRNLAAAAAAALRVGNRLCGTSCRDFFRHQLVVLGRHGVNHLSGKLLKRCPKECNPRATAKPIAGTYPEGSRTLPENRSTEVLQKEREEPVEKE